MPNKPNVLLVGAGGVGAMASFALEYSGESSVTSVLRSDYAHVVENGFKINSCDYGRGIRYRPSNVVNSIEASKQYVPFDYVVLATKCIPGVSSMIDIIAPAVSKDTAIVLIQNGIGIEDEALFKCPGNVILSGVSIIASSNVKGHIEHSGRDFLSVGYFENVNLTNEHQEKVCKRFVSMYKNDKNQCVFDENVKYSRWRKLVYNACLNPVCALTEADVGRLEIFGGTDSIIRKAMKGVIAIAKSDSVELSEALMDFMIRSKDPVYYRPSMLVDIDKGNPLEVEVICGNPVRIAKKNGVEAPYLTLIYDLLKVAQGRIMEKRGMLIVPKERQVPK